MDENKEVQKKDIKPVSGNIVQRERTTGEKIKKSFFSEDVSSIKDYLIFDVIIPSFKNIIADLVEDTVSMVLFGDTRRRTNKSKGSLATRVSYADYYNKGRNDRDVRSSIKSTKKSTDRIEYDEIAFETKADAVEARDQLIDIISEYETASVADFYEICKKEEESNFTDNNYGWVKNDIQAMDVERARNGYYISLPRPRKL